MVKIHYGSNTDSRFLMKITLHTILNTMKEENILESGLKIRQNRVFCAIKPISI